MNLRQATRDSIERAICRVRGRDAARSGVRDGVGGARRRVRAQGHLPLHRRDLVRKGDRDGAARARARSRARRRALVARRRAAHPRAGRRSHRGDQRGDAARARERPGAPGARHARCGSARATSPPRFPPSARRSRSIRRLAIRTCSSALLLAWEGQLRPRPRRSAAAPSSCRTNTSRATPACRSSARTRASATCFYLQGRYDEAIREYERGLAFVGSSDHALEGAHAHRDQR